MSEQDRKNESIDFIQKCLDISQDNDILLEVVYTAFLTLSKDPDKLDKSMQDSLWYWLKFKSKYGLPKSDNDKLNDLIEKMQQIKDVYSK